VAGAERKGTIAIGSDADLAVLNSSGEVQASIAKGTRVQQ